MIDRVSRVYFVLFAALMLVSSVTGFLARPELVSLGYMFIDAAFVFALWLYTYEKIQNLFLGLIISALFLDHHFRNEPALEQPAMLWFTVVCLGPYPLMLVSKALAQARRADQVESLDTENGNDDDLGS